MKISILSHHFPPKYHSGAEQYAFRIAQALQKAGHLVEVICFESINEGSLIPSDKVDIYEGLEVHRLYVDLNQAPDPLRWSFHNPQLGDWLKDHLEQTCPDVVFINSGYLLGGASFEAAFDLGIPTIVFLHDYWFLCPQITLLRTNGSVCSEPASPARCAWCELSKKRRFRLSDQKLHGKLGDAFTSLAQVGPFLSLTGMEQNVQVMAERQAYLKSTLERADLAITPSRFLGQKLEEYGYHPRRLVYLPFGLEPRPQAVPGPERNGSPIHFGYLGQIYPHKGVHLLISAFRELNRLPGRSKLDIFGFLRENDPYIKELKKLAGDDPDIQFAGPYPNSQVDQVLAGLDALVVPSMWYENRPTVIVEAHASQTPVVAAQIGGITELVHHDQDGLLFEPGQIDDLTRQLQRLLDEPDLLPRLRQAIQPVDPISTEVTRLVELFESVL